MDRTTCAHARWPSSNRAASRRSSRRRRRARPRRFYSTHVINFDPPHGRPRTNAPRHLHRWHGGRGSGVTFVTPEQPRGLSPRLAKNLGHADAFAASGLVSRRPHQRPAAAQLDSAIASAANSAPRLQASTGVPRGGVLRRPRADEPEPREHEHDPDELADVDERVVAGSGEPCGERDDERAAADPDVRAHRAAAGSTRASRRRGRACRVS